MKQVAQIGRFGVVGALATGVHVAVFIGLIELLDVDPFWANLPAFSAAVLVSYFGNLVWTFDMQAAGLGRLPRFVLIALIGLVANQAIVLLIVDVLSQSHRLAIAVVVVVVPTMTYLGSRWWAFAPAGKTANPD